MAGSECVTELECPCCGDTGAVAEDDHGMFFDGQGLVCGCAGLVSCDAETDPYVAVDDDCPCDQGEG